MCVGCKCHNAECYYHINILDYLNHLSILGPELVHVELSCKSHKGLANLQDLELRNWEVVKLDKYVGQRVKRKQLAIVWSS